MLKILFSEAIEKSGGNQEKLGKKFGIPQQRVSEFMNYNGSGRKPSDKLIGELAEYVGWNPIYTVIACKVDTDKKNATLWEKWRSENEWHPVGDSNPCYRRERAGS